MYVIESILTTRKNENDTQIRIRKTNSNGACVMMCGDRYFLGKFRVVWVAYAKIERKAFNLLGDGRRNFNNKKMIANYTQM